MTSTITLQLNNTAKIVVPDSLDLITPYVLQEQQDWFEDEIKFLRQFLKPGQKIIDIGANYGVYTLSMAETIGETGKIWAFEPAASTAKLLAEGITINGFTQIILDQSALSHTNGTAELSINSHSELNSLVHNSTGHDTTETVKVVTLDECMDRYSWQHIDFIKIDAEGEEINILAGGERFFSELSPLVQYEIKVDKGIDFVIVEAFAKLGYSSYRLVPGLNLLVPFDVNTKVDGFMLNLFCCKADSAAKIGEQGYLLNAAMLADNANILARLSKRIKMRDRYSWQQTIGKLPYGHTLKSTWEQANVDGSSIELNESLAFYALSCDLQLTAKERFTALKASFNKLQSLCAKDPAYLRLASLARVATDFGAREIAGDALFRLSNIIAKQQTIDLSEPFLAPGKNFDVVAPGENIEMWCWIAILEEFERIGSYSSFYTGASTQQRLEFICNSGFNGKEMNRRLSLIQRRFNLPIEQLEKSAMN